MGGTQRLLGDHSLKVQELQNGAGQRAPLRLPFLARVSRRVTHHTRSSRFPLTLEYLHAEPRGRRHCSCGLARTLGEQ